MSASHVDPAEPFWPSTALSRAARGPVRPPDHESKHESDAPALLTTHAAAIESAIALVCQRKRLSPDDRDELRSSVYVKLLENDCSVLRQFRGDSQLRTFLFVVVDRILLDLRNARWGKWRPSAAARRLGPAAMRLEELVGRDGLSRDDAESVLRRDGEWPAGEAARRALHHHVVRPHRRFVDVAQLGEVADGALDPEASLIQAATAADRRQLAGAIDRLDANDQALLRMRYRDGLAVCRIAALTGMPAAVTYRRFEAIYRRLRAELGLPAKTRTRM